jgi:CheY-like chemotaxis protein
VADDESAIGHFSADSMVGHGCYADAAEDGAVAWKAVQAKQFDLPIHDNFMSNFTGIELVKYLIRVHAFCNQT